MKLTGMGGASILADMASGRGVRTQEPARTAVATVQTPILSIAYQYYFNTERGRAGLTTDRHAICRLSLAAVVTELALHRRDVQPHGPLVRQS